VLAAVLNLAAWPVLSVLPAVAQDIDARAHVLGLLVGAFYAGAAAVSWAVGRLRRRFPYGRILFVGFLGAGLLILGNAVLTAWRAPGYDAVLVAGLTLVPIGLAVALDSSLLQALVQLSTPEQDQAPVLVVYATVTTIVTPIGGLAIGAVADSTSLWGALGLCGAALTALALLLRTRLRVFDDIGSQRPLPAGHGHHLHLMHLLGWDVVRGALTDFHDHAVHEPGSEPAPARA
jgi:MFS family permease